MIFFNGSLESIVGSELSLFFIHITACVLTLFSFLKRAEKSERVEKNRLFLLAGLIGILIVVVTNRVFLKGGVLLALSGTFTGQIIAATSLEIINRKKLTKTQLLSMFLIISSSFLLGYINRLPFVWVLISWLPGLLLFIQTYMNSQNILSVGTRTTLIFHFGTVLIILIPYLLINNSLSDVNWGYLQDIPIQFLVGGGTLAIFVISISSYLLLRLPAITFVLLLYTGQLTGAVILDYIMNIPFSFGKLIVLIIISLGLFLNTKRPEGVPYKDVV